jgi:hypothetical protein
LGKAKPKPKDVSPGKEKTHQTQNQHRTKVVRRADAAHRTAIKRLHDEKIKFYILL